MVNTCFLVKKVLIVRSASSATIALILLLLDWSSAFSQLASVTRRDSRQLRCEQPIGRVLSNGDSRLAAGSLLCKGDRLQPANGATVQVLCYLNREVLQLGSGVVSNKCVPLSEQHQAQQCTPQSRANCPRRKGPGEERNTPTLLNPYSSALLNTRPYLSWYAMAGATSYTVQVKGKDVNWERTVSKNALPYPQEQPAMQYGNVYKVTVIANQGDSPVTASSSVLIVSPESEVQQVRATVKQIQNLNLPQDETAFDLDTVYMSQDLLTEAINTLKARIQAGSQNPTLYRILGDRYLEAGLPDSAKREYTTAAVLAKKADNLAELTKAQAGLKRAALYSQLPTRTNPDQ